MNIIEVKPDRLDEVWPLIEPIMKLPVEKSHGEVTLQTTFNRINGGIARLFIVIDNNKIIALSTFEIRTFDSGERALYMPMMGGINGGMIDVWGEEMHRIGIEMAKEHNCRELRAICARNGWLRVLKKKGWREEHTIMSLEV